ERPGGLQVGGAKPHQRARGGPLGKSLCARGLTARHHPPGESAHPRNRHGTLRDPHGQVLVEPPKVWQYLLRVATHVTRRSQSRGSLPPRGPDRHDGHRGGHGLGQRHDALVMSKIAFVFPGQGSQAVGMGKGLFDQFAEAREVFGAADDALAEKLSATCFDGPEDTLRLTANAQPAILTVSLAAHAVASKRLPKPDYVAGHSLGEFSALAAAGSMSLPDAVRSVRARGKFMQEAVPVGKGAMSAVLGLDAQKLAQACKDAEAELASQGKADQKVQIANLNEPSQTVISGHAEAVAKAGEKATALGAKKVIPLSVSAPFHSSLMAPVQKQLEGVLASLSFKAPAVPVVTNVAAEPNSDPARIAPLLVAQVTAPVRWVETIQKLRSLGVEKFVELGPGRVLSGLIKRIDRNASVFHVEDPPSLQKTEAELGA